MDAYNILISVSNGFPNMFLISRHIKKKAWNPGKSQLFAENFALRFKWFFQ